jgi:hypothetical protein
MSPSRVPPSNSASSTSITGIDGLTLSITAENSVSVISSLASPCSSMKAMACASSRVLRALSTAPHIGTPKCASYMGGVLGSITATVSPTPTPRRDSADARRRARAYVSFHV